MVDPWRSLPSSCASRERRRFLCTSAGVSLGLAAGSLGAQAPNVLRLGQTVPLTGPLAELGQAVHEGAKACFAMINARGGINGKTIELVAKDDAYDTQRGKENVEAFVRDPSIFALFNCFGTPMVEACLPLLRSSGIPFFAPYTGAQLARPKDMRNVFNVRASYAQEAEQIVQHLHTIGTNKIAIIYQHNTFGEEVFKGMQIALEKRKLAPVAVATIENDSSDADAAVRAVLTSQPQAVLLGLAGKPTIAAVKGLRTQKRGLPLYALSVMGTPASLKALGEHAVGMTVSQIVPRPTNPAFAISREFMEAWRALGTSLPLSHTALEGYVNARVFAEALRRAGRAPTRASFIDSVWNLRQFDLGGFEIGFTGPGSNASSFIELTMVGQGSKFIH